MDAGEGLAPRALHPDIVSTPHIRHPELVSGSYFFNVGSKTLKQVQGDGDGHLDVA